jgi:hypothetical protein
VLLEPPRAPPPRRRPATPILKTRAAHAQPRRRVTKPALPNSARTAALCAGGALTLTGRGDLWTLAIALGVADSSMLTALAVTFAGVATLARTGSAALTDIAGSQAVLGAAGFTGSAAAVAATWTSALSLILVARQRAVGIGLGLLAGALVAGPSLSGGGESVAVWILGLAAGAAVGFVVVPRRDRRPWQAFVAVAVGAAGVALGVIAGYH